MKYKVKVGTLGFEQGIFQKGDIIEVTEERAKLFDKLDVEAVPEPIKTPEPIVTVKPEPEPVPVEVKPDVVSKKKTTVKPVIVEEAHKEPEPTTTNEEAKTEEL